MNAIQTLLDKIVKHMTSLKSCGYVMAGMTVLANKMVSIRRTDTNAAESRTIKLEIVQWEDYATYNCLRVTVLSHTTGFTDSIDIPFALVAESRDKNPSIVYEREAFQWVYGELNGKQVQKLAREADAYLNIIC